MELHERLLCRSSTTACVVFPIGKIGIGRASFSSGGRIERVVPRTSGHFELVLNREGQLSIIAYHPEVGLYKNLAKDPHASSNPKTAHVPMVKVYLNKTVNVPVRMDRRQRNF